MPLRTRPGSITTGFVAGLVFLLALGIAARAAIPSTQPVSPIASVERVELNVYELQRSTDFFVGVLSFSKTGETERADGLKTTTLRLGDERIELNQDRRRPGRPVPADSRTNDRWFQHLAIITSDMDAAYKRLREHKVRHASSAPQRLPDWNRNAGGIKAFYFLDPDNHVLEILQFPPGKGDPKWQQKGRLFLGIDHTAVVIADTDASLRFYRDQLGMHVAGESENWGEEQEHLNGIFGAHVRITSLRAARGPGVELLEYLSPLGGRPYPYDTTSSDLWAWRTVVSAPASNDPTSRVAHDPDGHLVDLVAPAQSAAR